MTRYLVLLVLLILGSAVANATSCGEGGDGSVPNCCNDFEGRCDTVCDTGYGLTSARDRCVKCSASSCVRCDGDSPSTCIQVSEKPVANCLEPGPGGDCDECRGGYDLVEGKKDDRHQIFGVKTCEKCNVKNCRSCSSKSPKDCAICKNGYGLGTGKNCVKCTVANCNDCAMDYRACQGCDFGDSKKPYYGLVVKGKGKKKKYTCVQCPTGCMFCDGGKCRDE